MGRKNADRAHTARVRVIDVKMADVCGIIMGEEGEEHDELEKRTGRIEFQVLGRGRCQQSSPEVVTVKAS